MKTNTRSIRQIGGAFAAVLAIGGALQMPQTAAAQSVVAINGHIESVESTYMPNGITVTMDAGAGLCPEGSSLFWRTTTNIEATYSSMLAALLAGKRVLFWVYPNDAGCVGHYFTVFSSN